MDGTAGPTGSQRRHRRAGVETRVDLEITGVAGFVSGMSEDISVGGMFVRLAVEPAEGAPARFGFRLSPDEAIIRGVGEVAWVREADEQRGLAAGVAVEFLNLSDEHRARIAGASRAVAALGLATAPSDETGDDEQLGETPSAEGSVVAPGDDAGETAAGDEPDPAPAVTVELDDAEPAPPDPPSPVRQIGDVTLSLAPAVELPDTGDEPVTEPERLPFPWALLAGMAAIVVLAVSVGALLLAPARDARTSDVGSEPDERPVPAAAPSATPTPPPVRRSGSPPASRLADVRWTSSLRSTRVELIADGLLTADRVATEALIDPPRFVIRIDGLARGQIPSLLETEGPDIRRIRIDRSLDDRSLEVILDLKTPTVRVTTAVEANRIALETR